MRAVVSNAAGRSRPRCFVKVSIATGSFQVLAVPQGAVHGAGGDTYVLIVKGTDAFERRPAKLGAEFDGKVEVLDGVAPADRVVATGGILLKQTTQ